MILVDFSHCLLCEMFASKTDDWRLTISTVTFFSYLPLICPERIIKQTKPASLPPSPAHRPASFYHLPSRRAMWITNSNWPRTTNAQITRNYWRYAVAAPSLVPLRFTFIQLNKQTEKKDSNVNSKSGRLYQSIHGRSLQTKCQIEQNCFARQQFLTWNTYCGIMI